MKNTRKIKFRVWNDEDSRWHEGVSEYCQFGKFLELNDPEYWIYQQYIGFTDINDQEIYEGDIVKFTYEAGPGDFQEAIGEVFFEEGIFFFGRRDYFATNDSNFCEKSIEVIGNIFENQDLLK